MDEVGIIYKKKMKPRDGEADIGDPSRRELCARWRTVHSGRHGNGGIVAWESTRQASQQCPQQRQSSRAMRRALEAVSSLVEMLEAKKVRKMILGDNAAAISIITAPGCAWRSRQLKCRAGKLTELIEEEDWRSRHLRTLLAVDGLTKALAKTQLEKRRRGVGLDVLEERKVKKALGGKLA